MNLPILVVIPYWEKDRNQAHDLCKLISGMQQEPSQEAEFLLVARQDCSEDATMREILSRKFKVNFYRCESPLRGWPSGANGMFGRSMCYVSNIPQKYEGVFWMEPDCVPIRRDWIKLLHDEWKKRPNKVCIVGFTHSVDGTDDGMHVNGNAIYDQQIARLIPEITYCDSWAWDWQHRHKMLQFTQHTNLIINKYKATNAQPSDMDDRFALIHGYKDDSLIKLVAGQFKI